MACVIRARGLFAGPLRRPAGQELRDCPPGQRVAIRLNSGHFVVGTEKIYAAPIARKKGCFEDAYSPRHRTCAAGVSVG